MVERRKFGFDRRSGNDRRKVYKLGYFLSGGVERRRGRERRTRLERRTEWTRVNEWSSVFVGDSTVRGSL
jgi:hypothetical protein